MGNKTWIKRPELPGRWERATGERHTFQLQRRKAYVLEVRDLHFHHDSAVLLPEYVPDSDSVEKKPFGFDALRTCYLHAKEHPERKILLAGHADTTGADEYNVGLTEKRADSVLHALVGRRDEWVKISQGKHKVEDYQLIVKWVNAIWGWGCDPGPVDGKKGPKTKKAVEIFQKNYNAAFGMKIAEDGIVGKQTWQAIFDIYMEVLASSLDTDQLGLAIYRTELKFFSEARKTVGCGENWPIEKPLLDEYKSRTNRRVEIVFLEPKNEPKLECHPSKGKCEWEKCELYDPKPFVLEVIPIIIKKGAQPKTLKLMVTAQPASHPRLLVTDGTEKVFQTWEEKDGERHKGTVMFSLDPASLPTPTQFVVEQWGFRYPHGSSFDPANLLKALEKGDSLGATDLIYGINPSPAEEPASRFLWDPPASQSATTAGVAEKTPTFAASAAHFLMIQIDRGEENDIDLKNPLVKRIKAWLGKKTMAPLSDEVVAFDQLDLPKTTEYELLIQIPDPSGDILHLEEKLKFSLDKEGRWFLSNDLHPRLHALKVEGKPGPSSTVTLLVDVAFLNVTKRVRDLNPFYRDIRKEVDDKSIATTSVREDPRTPLEEVGGKPFSSMTYLLVHGAGKGQGSTLDLLLYFENESDNRPDAVRHQFDQSGMVVLSPAAPGRYGEAVAGGYAHYPLCGWAAQVAASGADVLLVIPNVPNNFTKPTMPKAAAYGVLGQAGTGIKRVQKLVFLLWADRPEPRGERARLDKLIIAGWSSGMNIVFQWFKSPAAPRIDGIVCFDAVGPVGKTVDGKFFPEDDPADGGRKNFPSPDAWNQWLKSKEAEDKNDDPKEKARKEGKNAKPVRHHAAFISGGYSEETAAYASQNIDQKHILLKKPDAFDFWYKSADYMWAHHDATFPSPIPASPAPNTVYFASQQGELRRSMSPILDLRHSSKIDTPNKIGKVSLVEAADYMRFALGMPASPTWDEFIKAMNALRNGSEWGSEWEPSGRIRHPWTICGVETIQGSTARKGYLQLVLEAAVAKGLLK